MHSSINRGVATNPDCAHLHAMKELKEEILRKHPDACDSNENARRVKRTATKKQQNCKNSDCNDQQFEPRTITLKNGKETKHHHSCQFDDEDFKQFAHEQKKTPRNEHWAAKRNGQCTHRKNQNQNRGSNQRPSDWKKESQEESSRIVSSIVAQLKDSDTVISALTQQNNTPPTPPGLPSSMMGGQNSQDTRNKGGQTE